MRSSNMIVKLPIRTTDYWLSAELPLVITHFVNSCTLNHDQGQ
jgi:hypothetical protein